MKAFKKLAVFVVALLMALSSVLLVACDGGLGTNGGDNTGNNTPPVSRFNEIKAAYSAAGYNTELEKDQSVDASTAQLVSNMETMYGELGYNLCFIGKNMNNALNAEMYMLIGANTEAVNELAKGFDGTYQYKKNGPDIIVYIWSIGTPNFAPFDSASVAEEPGDNENKPAAEVVAKALENLTKQKLSSMTGTVTVTPTKHQTKSIVNDEVTMHNYLYGDKKFLEGSISGNYAGGNADIFLKSYTGQEEGNTEYIRKPEYVYMFLRDWDVFTDFTREEKELNELDLYDDGNLSDDFGIKPDYVEKMARFNHFFVYLCNAMDAVTVNGNTLTADLNKMAYGLVSSLKDTVNSLTPTMTVGELLRDKTVSNILSAAVNMLTPQEAVKIALENLVDNEDIKEYADIIIDVLDKVQLDEGSTTYDYILKLISSDEMYEAVSGILKEQMDVTLPAKLDNLTLNFVFDTLDTQLEFFYGMNEFIKLFDETKSVTDFASMKSALTYLVDEALSETTQSLFVVDVTVYGDETRAEVSGAKIVYQLVDGKITTMHIEGEYKQNVKESYMGFDHDKQEEVQYGWEGVFECTASADINFAAQKQTLTQIVLPQDN